MMSLWYLDNILITQVAESWTTEELVTNTDTDTATDIFRVILFAHKKTNTGENITSLVMCFINVWPFTLK